MIQRRPVLNGVTMFVTANTWHRRAVFLDPACAAKAVDYLYRLIEGKPVLLFGFVIMPDHLHLLLKIDAPYTIVAFMNDFMTGLSFEMGKGAFFEEHYDLRTPQDPAKTLRYITEKPVKAKLAGAETYPWSSASGMRKVSPLSLAEGH